MVPVQWSLVSGDAFQKDPNVIIRRVENNGAADRGGWQ